MKHKSFGFTLIEVTLFLAVTGALFVGIMVGTQNSIRSQRYNDSVQSFANFWRDIYASVSNTQNPQGNSGGRSEDAIYGKLVVFGQEYALNGSNADATTNTQKVFFYDVTGKVDPLPDRSWGNTLLDALYAVGANVLIAVKDEGSDSERIEYAGFADSYTPTWGALIQNDDKVETNGNTFPFEGSVLVVKHPKSNAINTYYTGKILQINKWLAYPDDTQDALKVFEDMLAPSNRSSNPAISFISQDIDFCINSDDIGASWLRRQDVRLIANASNVSGVEVIGAGNENNKCTNQ